MQINIVEGQLEIGMVKEGSERLLPTKADTNWIKTLRITPGMLSTHNHYIPCTVLYTSTQEKYDKQFVH